ncbi:Uncharacterised protein [uncultured archaeon]|nr:Uncharacterised protein [uncultured archaeon]
MEKRGVSPVIATVLLIAIVVVLALVLFLWFRSFTQEATLKNGKNIELVCEEVRFSAEYESVSSTLSVSNEGNIPISELRLLVETPGERSSIDILGSDLSARGFLEAGQSGSVDLSGKISGSATKISVIPVLKGVSSKGESTYVCGDRYAQEINIIA